MNDTSKHAIGITGQEAQQTCAQLCALPDADTLSPAMPVRPGKLLAAADHRAGAGMIRTTRSQ